MRRNQKNLGEFIYFVLIEISFHVKQVGKSLRYST
jgi:hypothetical protein